jgi:hypothetical protein
MAVRVAWLAALTPPDTPHTELPVQCSGASNEPVSSSAVGAHRPVGEYHTLPIAMGRTALPGFSRQMSIALRSKLGQAGTSLLKNG